MGVWRITTDRTRVPFRVLVLARIGSCADTDRDYEFGGGRGNPPHTVDAIAGSEQRRAQTAGEQPESEGEWTRKDRNNVGWDAIGWRQISGRIVGVCRRQACGDADRSYSCAEGCRFRGGGSKRRGRATAN